MNDKRTRLTSWLITIGFHLLIVLLLVLFGFPRIEPEEESGVLLMVGQVEMAGGEGRPSDVSSQTSAVTPVEATPAAAPEQPIAAEDAPMIAQNTEEAPAIAPEKPKETKKVDKKTETKKPEVKKPEKKQPTAKEIAAEKRRQEAEAQKKAEEKRRQEEEARKAAEAKKINDLIAKTMQGSGTSGNDANHGSTAGSGQQGSPNGNSTQGASHGSPGWGDYDLGGRGMRGSLPKPTFNVNESGTVVVSIAVDAAGNVTSATVRPQGTNTSSKALRDAATKAAQKAKFISEANAGIQYGTITYRFDSNN